MQKSPTSLHLKLNEHDDILQLYSRATAPCRDYYGLIISRDYLALNIWKITHGPHSSPKIKYCPLREFKIDKNFQETIKNSFGLGVFQFLYDMSNDQKKLENLPTRIFFNLLKYLKINDILTLMMCSKILYERCNQNNVWRLIFFKKFNRLPSKEENLLALDYTWKEIYKKRLAYVKKALENSKKQQKNMEKKKQNPINGNRVIRRKVNPVK